MNDAFDILFNAISVLETEPNGVATELSKPVCQTPLPTHSPRKNATTTRAVLATSPISSSPASKVSAPKWAADQAKEGTRPIKGSPDPINPTQVGEGAIIAARPIVSAPLPILSPNKARRLANDGAKPSPLKPDAIIPPYSGANEANKSSQPIFGTPRSQSSFRKRGKVGQSFSEPHKGAADLQPSAGDSGDAGQTCTEPHMEGASIDISAQAGFPGHRSSETHGSHAGGELMPVRADDGVHVESETLKLSDPVIDQIVQLWRLRQRWHRAEKSLVLQSKAICRGWAEGDKKEAAKLYDAAKEGGEVPMEIVAALNPFFTSIETFEKQRGPIEKELRKLTRQLPIWTWAAEVRGVGEMSIAAIVGEACGPQGDVGSYRTVSCLWKRMGLAVFDGKRQRKVSDADEAIRQGYNASRRSVMWNIGGSIIGGMGRGPRVSVGQSIDENTDLTYYQKVFVARCRYEATRDNGWRDPVTHTSGDVRESYSAHVANSAKRYVEKRFLRYLWAAWRALARGETPRFPVWTGEYRDIHEGNGS